MDKPRYRGWEPLVLPIAALAIWMIVASKGRKYQLILPPLPEVVSSFGRLVVSFTFYRDVGLTLLRTLSGFALGVSLGLILGLAMGSWRRCREFCMLSVDALRSIPATVLFPVFMLFLGYGFRSMLALVAFPCCWLVAVNSMYGVVNSDPTRRELAKALRLTQHQTFWRITLPDAMPSVAASMRLSIAMSLHMALIGEMFMGITSGIGYRIFNAHMLLHIGEMYALIIVVGVLGFAVNKVCTLVEDRIFFWGQGSR